MVGDWDPAVFELGGRLRDTGVSEPIFAAAPNQLSPTHPWGIRQTVGRVRKQITTLTGMSILTDIPPSITHSLPHPLIKFLWPKRIGWGLMTFFTIVLCYAIL